MEKQEEITILEHPIVAKYIQWVIDHPECDSIIEDTDTGDTMRVFAFAKSKSGNKALHRYRNEHFPNMSILIGMTKDGVNSIV